MLGLAVLPLNPDAGLDMDVVDEALHSFRSNIYFKNFEIEGPADRVLVYLYVVISHCLKVIQKK